MPSRGISPLFGLLGALLLFFLAMPLVFFWTAMDAGQLGQVLGDSQTVRALLVSVGTATLSVAILAVLGVPLGYLLARSQFPGKTWLNILVFLPLICPPAASGILLLLFFGPNQGLGQLLQRAGIQLIDNLAGIILAQTFVAAPFVVVTARAAFEAVPEMHEKLSLTLGEGPWMTFWRVALPLARDGILAGIVLAWMRCMGEFGATIILAYHPYTLPVLMWVNLTGTGLASALPVVLLALIVTLFILSVLFRVDRRLALRTS
ncbi:MAG: ABC transporter permease [Chloroflexota bacterium]|nr:ABC transporter permease [Chloroflexota bacterium]